MLLDKSKQTSDKEKIREALALEIHREDRDRSLICCFILSSSFREGGILPYSGDYEIRQ